MALVARKDRTSPRTFGNDIVAISADRSEKVAVGWRRSAPSMHAGEAAPVAGAVGTKGAETISSPDETVSRGLSWR
jgi:hypothetical protein